MKKLEFPIISGPLPEKKQLSMDDYLEFVQFNLKNTCDIETTRKLKKKLAVKIPFIFVNNKSGP
ncbi:MAG: hypothetical protein HQ564_07540 [Candidatus Saganbacteria bacterium]|nr:hypothetical protein [Candidatus Saganbacteria bacterium]